MSFGDVYLADGFSRTQREACDYFFIQLSPPRDDDVVLFCVTSKISGTYTLTSGNQGNFYNICGYVNYFPYGVSIQYDELHIQMTTQKNLDCSKSTVVFRLPRHLIKSIHEGILQSNNISGIIKNLIRAIPQ